MGVPRPQDDVETRALAARCVAGDAGAWRALIDRFAPRVAAKAERVFLARTRRAPDPLTRDELVQDVFVRLFQYDARALRNFRWSCPFEAFLSTVVASVVMDRIRRDAGARTRWGTPVGVDEAVDSAEGREKDPAAGLRDAEEHAALRRHVEALPPRERTAVELHFWGGTPVPRVAKLMGVSPDSVHDWIRQAASRLARRMNS